MLSKLLKLISNNEENSVDTSIFSLKKKNILLIVTVTLLTILFFLFIIILMFLPILLTKQYLKDSESQDPTLFKKTEELFVLNGWCQDSSCDKESIQKYYEKLEKIYNEYKNKGTTIDIELITATIFYHNTLRNDLFIGENVDDEDSEIEESELHLNDIKKLASNMVTGSRVDYNKYKNYLINTYIPKRFSNMYKDSTDKESSIERIADEIMSFASKTDIASNGRKCVTYGCDTVFLTGDYAGEYSLDDYVKGVVNAESGGFISYTNNYKEQWKAQAIAARSMVLNQYDICNQSVPNTTNFQAFKPGWSQELSDVVDETAGMVLTDNNEIFLAQYDAFYEGNGSNYHCDGELCYSTYYKKGSGTDPTLWEKHEIQTYSKYTPSFAQYPNGHGIGLSQWGAAYLADTGKKYDEILNYYYADNIEISKIGNSCSVDTTGYDWRQGDERWGYKSYGGTTLAAVGCNFTSIVIEIARSGKPTTIADFNPGTAFDYMKSRGYLGYNGSTLNYAAFSEMAPDFKYSGNISMYGYTHEQIRNTLAKLIDDNKYPIIHVKSVNNLPYSTSNHWVAVVGYTEDDVEIIDPANTGCTRLFTCKPGLDKSNGYGTSDEVAYWE